MITNQVEGWVFVGFPDEHLRSMLRPGSIRLWDDARTIGKLPGQTGSLPADTGARVRLGRVGGRH